MWFRVAEWNLEVQCTCGVTQRADKLQTSVSNAVTLYACPHCAKRLIGVARDDRPPDAPDVLDGHRMCGYVFGTTVEMKLIPPATAESFMDIPPAPGFFSARGCD